MMTIITYFQIFEDNGEKRMENREHISDLINSITRFHEPRDYKIYFKFKIYSHFNKFNHADP